MNKRITFTVPQEIIWRLKAMDPQQRQLVGTFVKDIVLMYLANGEAEDIQATLARRVPAPKPLRKTAAPVSKRPVPFRLNKDTSYPSRATQWFVSQSKMDELERFARDKPVELILSAGGTDMYRLPFSSALFDTSDVNAIRGEPYYLLNVELLEAQDGLVAC